MANEIFYVKVKTSKNETFYAFSRSETGILDYAGVSEPHAAELTQMQRVEGSSYFTPSWYTYLPKALQAEIGIYLPANIQDLDTSHYSFLLHVGALLLAVQERDGLLAAELLHRRSMVFANYTPILLHVLKPVAGEALFAWIYGAFHSNSIFQALYKSDEAISTGETDTTTILYAAARDILKPDPLKESAEAMFVRYFKECGKTDLTIGIVGAANHPWVNGVQKFDILSDAAISFHFGDDPHAAGKKSQEVFASLKAIVQAEPYNPHDHNAISVTIDDLGAMLKGIPSKSKAGYLRATGAAILRKARPGLFRYEAELWRIGGHPDYFENAIVLRIQL